ncbi:MULTISPECIES: DNA-binding protein [unclassified Pseudomonas]|uniref:DNA-binding protein n=1 Tax=unclassified Pseudomonas TaxID=196821 RepID=UPI001CBF36D3|nr:MULTISPECIES: DNA-binding protein [unclassified Pseudomonas]
MSTQSSNVQLKSTRQWVHDYAARLLENGEEVRQTTIRELIAAEHGITASPNLVNDEIKKFWVKAGPLMSARLRRPGIPDEVCTSFDKIWDVALDAAAAGHELERKQLQAHADNAATAMKTAQANELAAIERFEGQTREIEGLRADKLSLTELLQANDAERKGLAAELKGQAEKSAAQHAMNMQEQQRLQGLVDSLQQQLTELRASSQRELTTLAESHQVELVKTQDFLMRETARVRDEEKVKTEKLTKELERERNEKDQLRQLRSKANEEASQLRGRLEATDRSLEKLEQRNAQLSEQNDRLQTALLESVKTHVSASEQKEEKPLLAPPASE